MNVSIINNLTIQRKLNLNDSKETPTSTNQDASFQLANYLRIFHFFFIRKRTIIHP